MPFLHSLRCEVKAASDYLSGHKLYVRLSAYYAGRKRPLFGHLASILSFQEDDSLKTTTRSFSSEPTCLMFDGAILRCDGLSGVEKPRRECADDAGEVGIGVDVEKWGASFDPR